MDLVYAQKNQKTNRRSNEEEVIGPFEKLADELYKSVRRSFTRRKVEVKTIDDIWGADLVEMQEWIKENIGYRYMMNVIDVFSKYGRSIPLNDKTEKSIIDAFIQIVKKSNRRPKYIWVDEGK